MVRVLFLTIFLLFTSSIAQESSFRKNALSVETGFFHRGLLGVSFTRNFLKTNGTFISTTAFAGMGFYYKRYTGLSLDFNVGKKEAFFCVGMDFKGILINDWKPLFGNGGPWQFAWEPHLGINIISTIGFTSKFVLGYMFTKEPEEGLLAFPGIGLSLGYAF